MTPTISLKKQRGTEEKDRKQKHVESKIREYIRRKYKKKIQRLGKNLANC